MAPRRAAVSGTLRDDGQMRPSLGPGGDCETFDVQAKHLAAEEEDGAERLILGTGGHLLSLADVGEEAEDLVREGLG
ncbi:MAG: hypothetical protein A3I61_19470 [Acidobacteria bacterium RIFCSPLOWO2_02_FULL_68_18]|nr:MAG: hypothetical protein A3I61_19470 [Acidobacteria bacterium RIFCSPLOWO2_02_FULL_68_18]OFW49048.1 MAG: hypothetical protein A3G77_11685 [Acidobacteria bacterium RIFCSPLOWO2_12_FULL_68_19]